MTADYLVNARIEVERKYRHLLSLLSPDEIELFEQEIPPDETPLWQYWEDYVVKTMVLGKSPITIKSVRDAINIVIRHTGLMTIEQINTPGNLDNALLELQIKRGQKSSTRNTYIKNMNTFFIWLYKNHHIDENMVGRIEKGRNAPVDVIPLTLEQIEKIIVHVGSRHHNSALERARNILIVDIFRFSGIRPCELLNMENDDIYEENGHWRMRIKGCKQKGRLRFYDAPSFLVHSYQHYMRLRDGKHRWEDPLIISLSSRDGLNVGGLQGLFQKISREIRFRVTAYGFRRFIASHMSRTGIARDDLSRYMGHTRFTTTDRYIARDCHLTKSGTEIMQQTYGGG